VETKTDKSGGTAYEVRRHGMEDKREETKTEIPEEAFRALTSTNDPGSRPPIQSPAVSDEVEPASTKEIDQDVSKGR
jgi:hypothetical protein